MITKDDIEFSKLSYTNKDFASLYPDLLDLAKQLTNLWDPSSSNESDPGVVLLKEGAFIADHNNYNIDKNVLECFLPSATQETSVRNLVEMNGYVPRYYISANGTLNFIYQVPDDEENPMPDTLEIPGFALKVSNEDGSITYTQGPETLRINKKGVQNVAENFSSVTFYEGTLNVLSVNGVENITLDNLDDNNRLYFPVKQVAQNGIFVSNTFSDGSVNYDFWSREKYLLSQPLGTKCYRLDYDSSMGLPYLEFPSDIANLIESGLTVRYIVSSGEYGNISANQLTKITSPAHLLDRSLSDEGVKVPTEYITPNNSKAMLNGKNPETIDEMYQSFKKYVHTFDTLVTCKDFQDAIYEMTDENDNFFIGNDIVADIKYDYNRAIKVMSYDKYGEYVKNIALTNGLGRLKFISSEEYESEGYEPSVGDIIIKDGKLQWYTMDKTTTEEGEEVIKSWQPLEKISYDDFVKASEAITPFDICVYTLKLFSMADYIRELPWYAYNKSFTPPVGDEASEIYKNDIIPELNKLKCLNHQFRTPESGDIICFKNYVPLRITIIPYTKVTLQERRTIYDNIYRAISENFNSRMLDFGEELNFDEVYKVIVNADDRIKSIRLENFEYDPRVLVMGHASNDGSEESKSNNFTEYNLLNDERVGNYFFIDLVAKNVLAGRICLFDIDDNFDHQYGQIDVHEYKGIKKIESELIIPLEKITGITEVDQSSEDEEESSESTGVLPTDVIQSTYHLIQNEYLQIAWPNYYTDVTYPTYVYYRYVAGDPDSKIKQDEEHELRSDESITLVWTQNGIENRKTYGGGNVIKPNFQLEPTQDSAYYRKVDASGEAVPFDILATNQQIEHKVELATILDDKDTYVYWITNENRKLFQDGNEDILNSGEYFIYTNKQRDAMVIFGTGTLLVKSDKDKNNWNKASEDVTIENINDYGFAVDMTWKQMDFTNQPFTIKEMNLLTLSQGDSIHINIDGSSLFPLTEDISNTWQKFTPTDIEYVINTDSNNESLATLSSNTIYYIRSRLDMSSDKFHGQELFRDQFIYIWTDDNTLEPIVIKNDFQGEPEAMGEKDRMFYQINTTEDILSDSKIDLNIYKEFELVDEDFEFDLRTYKIDTPVIEEVGTVNSTDITTNDGNLYITMDYKEAKVSVPFSYINEFSSLDTKINEYIFPLYIDDTNINEEDFVEIDVDIEGALESEYGNVPFKLTHYGREDIDESYGEHGLKLTSGGLHMLKLELTDVPWSSSESESQEALDIKINNDLVLTLNWNTPVAVAEYLTLMKLKIVGGINDNLANYTSLDEVMNRINELMANSNDSDAIPFLTFEPEKSMTIQNEELWDPTTLWDVNNVANRITIAQIDMYTMWNEPDNKGKRIGTIDIIKSMKAYTE